MQKLNYKHLLFFKSKLEEMESNLIEAISSNAKKYYQEKTSEELEAISNNLGQEVFIIEQRKRQELLKQIKFALLRIKNNVYGVCVKTGKLIDIKRLEANPTSLYDIKSQIEQEANFT